MFGSMVFGFALLVGAGMVLGGILGSVMTGNPMFMLIPGTEWLTGNSFVLVAAGSFLAGFGMFRSFIWAIGAAVAVTFTLSLMGIMQFPLLDIIGRLI